MNQSQRQATSRFRVHAERTHKKASQASEVVGILSMILGGLATLIGGIIQLSELMSSKNEEHEK